MMPLRKGKSREAVSQNIKTEVEAGKPQRQAIALSEKRRSKGRRTPYDGRPFYCTYCGIGFAEFLACEQPTCRLETEEAAEQRQRRHIPSESESGSGGKPR